MSRPAHPPRRDSHEQAGPAGGGAGNNGSKRKRREDRTAVEGHLERRVTVLNWDGKWVKDETLRQWMYERSGMDMGAGGIGIYIDVRLTEEAMKRVENQWWVGREADGNEGVGHVRLAYAASPKVDMGEGKGLKEMGGVLVMAWGDLANRASNLGAGEQDKHGRWAVMKLNARGGGKAVVIGCYRPPGGNVSGGLVSRMGKARGWEGKGLERKARRAFYLELGVEVRKWRSRGYEVLLGGDFNEECSPLEAGGGFWGGSRTWD